MNRKWIVAATLLAGAACLTSLSPVPAEACTPDCDGTELELVNVSVVVLQGTLDTAPNWDGSAQLVADVNGDVFELVFEGRSNWRTFDEVSQ